MEEDIKILEDLKNKWELNAFGDMVNVLSLDEIKAIENLLKRYKELEEENKRLNNHNLIGRIDAIKIEDLESVLKPYYIPISVIQNKINGYLEYDKIYKTHTSDGRENFTMEYFKAQTLKELLEERNK